ncbi:tRNA (adenosine(37)-N6)-threonylcarbamoyltransferase complex dimerization subunit type 1 TsaB [Neorickettsia findlayensis]|uniref:tRNA (Adenosine(37)-N6)-threonylcarbamoyltransferase complex dimerization subunit type 1 TsaB n=1 Tax=Neorickettsia findlayensis TaxID=2686014 RepID=A0A6P1GCC3_9RICK|nr:tRNA (adenosine(37)-N6)-threonylcarbamoyltransferase complex dimerization subunit type 1 TsaB [Neorickettsia findlayensis]QHD65451.1 tRNA (adenosine(37)-N6)-threonylcarbamoyltransferase complex dimerization subunit type 1 TsaB [Neorickettsia findlayensis]
MNVMSVDSSGEFNFSVAIVKDGEITSSKAIEGRFSEHFFPFLFSLERKTFEEIDLFAVNTGPGSYTGIRAAIAALQGLSIFSNKKLVGLNAFSVVLDKFERNNKEKMKNWNTIAIVLRGYNDSFFYLKELKRNFEEHTKIVRIDRKDLGKICSDILLTNIPGCGHICEVSAEDLALLALQQKDFKNELQPVVPLYI